MGGVYWGVSAGGLRSLERGERLVEFDLRELVLLWSYYTHKVTRHFSDWANHLWMGWICFLCSHHVAEHCCAHEGFLRASGDLDTWMIPSNGFCLKLNECLGQMVSAFSGAFQS